MVYRILGEQSAASPKLAQRAARRIEEDIFERKLPPGSKVGSEPALMRAYGISRTTFREAIRILEHDGVATMRRGANGGLIVTEPSTEAVAHAAAQWLRYNEASVLELYLAREVLESRSAAAAAERIDEEGGRLLRGLVEHERSLASGGDTDEYTSQSLQFHVAIAELSANTVYRLFVTALCDLTPVYGAYQRRHMVEGVEAHQGIAEAIISGDAAIASRRMMKHIRASRNYADWYSSQSATADGMGPAQRDGAIVGDDVSTMPTDENAR